MKDKVKITSEGEYEAQLYSQKGNDRFVMIEELRTKVEESQFAVAYYTILIDALEHGDFVIHNDKIPSYRIIRRNQPDLFSMFTK